MESPQVAAEDLQTIAGRHPKIFESYRRVEHEEFTESRSLDFFGDTAYTVPEKKIHRSSIGEPRDHARR